MKNDNAGTKIILLLIAIIFISFVASKVINTPPPVESTIDSYSTFQASKNAVNAALENEDNRRQQIMKSH